MPRLEELALGSRQRRAAKGISESGRLSAKRVNEALGDGELALDGRAVANAGVAGSLVEPAAGEESFDETDACRAVRRLRREDAREPSGCGFRVPGLVAGARREHQRAHPSRRQGRLDLVRIGAATEHRLRQRECRSREVSVRLERAAVVLFGLPGPSLRLDELTEQCVRQVTPGADGAGVCGGRVTEREAAARLTLRLVPVLLVACAQCELEDEVRVLRIAVEPLGDDRARSLDVALFAANGGEAGDEHGCVRLVPPVLVRRQEPPAALEVLARLRQV